MKFSATGNLTPQVLSSVAEMVQGPLHTTGQQPQSSSATAHPQPSSSPTAMQPVSPPPLAFLNSQKRVMKGDNLPIGRNVGNSAFEKCGAARSSAPKAACKIKAFNQHETEQGSAVIGGDEQALKRR